MSKTTMAMFRTVLLTAAAMGGVTALAAATNGVAVVRLADDARPVKYNPMIFGQFLEHFDNQVYGGVFEPGSKLSDEDGFRKDVLEALRDIKTPIVRWPGGCFVSAYHWKGGVGKVREPEWNKAWSVEEPNTFGTDEYVKWSRKLGSEPYICTNAGTGDAEEMSDWVEYCNQTQGKWAKLRAVNGHPEPYGVKYWSVGNENYGAWEIGAKTVEQWGPLVREAAKMMRGSDRSGLQLLAAAQPDERWTLPLLKTAGKLIDHISIHGYYIFGNWRRSYLDAVFQTERPEGDIIRAIKVLEKAGFGGGRIKIAFDEWNLRGWYHPGMGDYRRQADFAARRDNDIASTYTMADAVFSACFLNSCLRHADVVSMACFAPCVNTRGCVFAHKDGIVRRTTWHVFWMYTHLLEPNMRPVTLECGRISRGKASVAELDGILTTSDDGKRRVLALVNKNESQTVSLDLAVFNPAATLEAMVLVGDSPDAYNDIGNENRVKSEPRTLGVRDGKVELPAHSVVFLKL